MHNLSRPAIFTISSSSQAFAALDAKASGRDAQTVVREKGTGKKRDLEAERKEAEEKDRKEAERKAKYDRWGKGLVQAAAQATNAEDAMHEMSKPLTRHRDDLDLDAMLKDRVREEDPMLAFIGKKKASKGDVFALEIFPWNGPSLEGTREEGKLKSRNSEGQFQIFSAVGFAPNREL